MTIRDRSVTPEQVQSAVSKASTAWLSDRRPKKAAAERKRRHRALTQEEREAKALATATAKKRRADEREARELDRLLARIGYLSRRSQREAEAMLRVRVSWKSSAQPKVTAICPRNLYARMAPEVTERTKAALATRSRIAADGFKNIVLRKIPRGYGRKEQGTRAYEHGEAADLARYILREEALETGIVNRFSNILEYDGPNALYETDAFSVDDRRCAQIVAFWNALEAFEAEADADGNVYSHLILAMPHELSPEGRVKALEDFSFRLDALHLPFVASLHKPDAKGDVRNFHAHIIMSPRPFAIEGPFTWSFEAGKATELNSRAGYDWLRQQAAAAFNHALEKEGKPLRYTGIGQAKRGVPSTGETHDGPAKTARKRQQEADEAERKRLTNQLAAHVAAVMDRQACLGAEIQQILHPLVPSKPQPAISPALAALRKKFPNPLKLAGLSGLDLVPFTSADHASDDWFGPAYNLAVELRRGNWELVRDNGGQPELAVEKREEYQALCQAPALPDIVDEALREAHRRMVAERDWERRVRRDKERIRKQAVTWLRGAPVLLFDRDANVLPELRDRFPKHVMALDGVRQAMVDCHIAALELRRRPAAAATKRVPDVEATASEPGAALPPPAPQSPAVDDGVEHQLFDAVRQGLVKLPGKDLGRR
ncbi:MobA/MobL family protein [Sphingomonas sp. KRR8]|uniref:MobA/MobL family protein n=1 Tax=Sphingomonas sp. KRR8 TaxID=2942996 RepID=UPI0020210420|nr:MobA/MobL family protein [Sphingomonas sp. KRR8]URD59905.1 MobA/MobL family protein [Sphingomonas sp. KRR8]